MRLLLADTSAWHRSGRATDRWSELVEANALATCTPVALEVLYSTRGPADYEQLAAEFAHLPVLPINRRVELAAASAQAALAQKSQHRGPGAIDLLIAAIAEAHNATLLHYDRHFELIARVTGQPAEWLARPGSLD